MVELALVKVNTLLEKVKIAEQGIAQAPAENGVIPVTKMRVVKQGNRSYLDLTAYGIKPGTYLLGIKIGDVFVFVVEENGENK
jgi:hypothetical protein